MGRVSKKSMFFTFIAITVVALFILVFTPQSNLEFQKDNQATNTRIKTLDNFIDEIQNRYLEAVLRASAYKTLLSFALYVNSTGTYISNFDTAFSSVITTGKIGNTDIDSITGRKIMFNNTLTDWDNKIIDSAKDVLNVNTTIVVNNVSAVQENPWEIKVTMIANFTVNSNVAQWSRSAMIVTTSFSIEGLPDPYFLANTRNTGSYNHPIKKSSVRYNEWTLEKTREELRNETYFHWEDSSAPSYIMRLTNTASNSSCCGIETFVNPNKISPSDQTESYIDYLFWTHAYTTNCTVLYNVTGLWDEFKFFKLDLDSTAKYNVTDFATEDCQ